MHGALSHFALCLTALCLSTGSALAQAVPTPGDLATKVSFDIKISGKEFARFVSVDPKIGRPYFEHLHAPNGVQVTRNNPPRPGIDATDHDTFHPGLWLSFGDLGGADFWRNRARVEVTEFSKMGEDTHGFTVNNRYATGDKTLCHEVCKFRFVARPAGNLILWDSTFQGKRPFYFGDQEEMGLGVRLATPLTVKNGGEIINSDGKRNEKGVWGKSAKWALYRGRVDGKTVGVMLMPDPANFRPSWFHARDYGLLVANPFGANAFTKGQRSKVVVRAGQPFRLQFAVLAFAGNIDPAAEYLAAMKLLQRK